MNKTFKSLVSCILTIMILLLSSSMAFAQSTSYVALGDSTSYGLSDPGGGYVPMYGAHLGVAPVNLSVPGYTTTDLINVINKNQSLIKNASVITINIGGNNLLGPFIQSVGSLYGVNPIPGDLDGSQFLTNLALAIQAQPGDPGLILQQLMNPNNPTTKKLNAALLLGIAKFNLEWPVIVAKVRMLAPRAKIYVNTIFNPAMKAPATDPMYPFYQKMDALIQSMNKVIKAYSTFGRYKCVDVYAAFASSNKEILSFNIINAIAAVKQLPPNIPAFIRSCDPHPTTIGHQVIYETLLKAEN